MPTRRLPARPNLDQLKHQAKDLLRAIHAGDPAAIAELGEYHSSSVDPPNAKLGDARHVLARSYYAASWTRLVQAVQLADAIWRDDLDVVRELVTRNPDLVEEDVLIRPDSKAGEPMTYAANLGRDRIVRFLHSAGADNVKGALSAILLQHGQFATMGRVAFEGRIGAAKALYEMLGNPVMSPMQLAGAANMLSVEGSEFILELGGARDEFGYVRGLIDVGLQTDQRNPQAKHAILELFARHGVELPDTPPMAIHRGRIDLLEEHLRRDPHLLHRTFSHREIYPAEVGCGDAIDAKIGTPLGGTTLLHMCIEYDEIDIAHWLLDHGMDVNARAAVGTNCFGGYTALFSTVVSQPNFWMNKSGGHLSAPSTELLLERGADVNVRASVWKQLHPRQGDSTRHDYRDVTALSWGRRFHAPVFVSEPAMRLIEDAGGVE
jgi:ankyrin repeat protein